MKRFAIVLGALAAMLAGQTWPSHADDLSDCKSGDPDRMIAGCTRLLQSHRLKPVHQSNAYNNRGFAYQLKHDIDRAIDDYSSAIDINPNNLKAHNNRAIIYIEKRLYARAITDLDAAIALNPDDLMAYSNRGLAYQGLGIFNRAVDDYTKTLEISPNNPLLLNNRAYAYSLNGESEKALADMRAALALEPNNARMHHSLGEIYLYAGQEDKATAAWESVCRLASEEVNRMWQRNLAALGHYSGEIDGACDKRLIDAFRSCAREKCFLHS